MQVNKQDSHKINQKCRLITTSSDLSGENYSMEDVDE
jgi:hypothetical protein